MAAIAIDGSRAYALRRDMQAAVDAAVSRFGRLDILINNAGVGAGRRVDQRARSRGVGAGGATVNAFRPVSQSA